MIELSNFEKKAEQFALDIVDEFISCNGRLNEKQLGEIDGLIDTLNNMKSIATANSTYDYWVELLRDEKES